MYQYKRCFYQNKEKRTIQIVSKQKEQDKLIDSEGCFTTFRDHPPLQEQKKNQNPFYEIQRIIHTTSDIRKTSTRISSTLSGEDKNQTTPTHNLKTVHVKDVTNYTSMLKKRKI